MEVLGLGGEVVRQCYVLRTEDPTCPVGACLALLGLAALSGS